MSDLISRQAAITAIQNLYPCMLRINIGNSLYKWREKNKQYVECEEAINKLPSAQPERPRGKWIEDGYLDIPTVCSYCGAPGNTRWKYCPYCGAEIDLEDKEKDDASQWISCSEKSPRPYEDVLISTMRDRIQIGWIDEHAHWRFKSYYVVDDKPLAWMPLPKPYKKEKTDE